MVSPIGHLTTSSPHHPLHPASPFYFATAWPKPRHPHPAVSTGASARGFRHCPVRADLHTPPASVQWRGAHTRRSCRHTSQMGRAKETAAGPPSARPHAEVGHAVVPSPASEDIGRQLGHTSTEQGGGGASSEGAGCPACRRAIHTPAEHPAPGRGPPTAAAAPSPAHPARPAHRPCAPRPRP